MEDSFYTESENINHFLYSGSLIFWCFADPRSTAPPSICQFLEIVNNWPRSVVLKCKSTNAESIPQPPPLSMSHLPCHCAPVLITPGTGTRKLRTAFMSQSLLKSFKLINLKPAWPAFLIPSNRNHSEGSCPQFPSAS